MDWSVADLDLTLAIEPDERMLEPIRVVALWIILARVRAAALGAVLRRVQGDNCLLQQVLQLERLGKVAVPDHRTVRDAEIGEAMRDDIDPAYPFPQYLGSTKNRAIVLHHALHIEADLGGLARALGVPHRIEPLDRRLAGAVVERRMGRAGPHQLSGALRGGTAKDDNIEQRIAAEPVGAMHRHASCFADRHQPGNNGVRVLFGRPQYFAV